MNPNISKNKPLYPGFQIGYLIVKEFDLIANRWIFECVCGNLIKLGSKEAFYRKSKKCRECTMNDQYNSKCINGMPLYMYGRLKHTAKVRNIELNFSIEQMAELYEKQNKKCALTGVELTLTYGKIRPGTASLDRVDSSKGYIENNVQWIHKDINMMKRFYSEEYFIELCKMVVNYHNLKSREA